MRAIGILGIGLLGGVLACNREATLASAVPAEGDDTAELRLSRIPAQLAAIAPAAIVAIESDHPVCPTGMILVEGMYCPELQHQCKRYMDPPGRYEHFRCAEYVEPAKCLSKQRKKLRFCMDRDEYVPKGESLPANHQSWTLADRTCRGLEKRMCMESEWNFACEGEQLRPYPYGFKRDASACNADRTDIVNDLGVLKDLRAPGSEYPRCVSPFGVRNLSGNLEEFVSIDRTTPTAPAMKGAYWQPSQNFCRAAQTAHDRFYNGTETGFRCCSDLAE